MTLLAIRLFGTASFFRQSGFDIRAFLVIRHWSLVMPRMRLYIIRHAWAEEPGDARWPSDADRPLTADGKKRFKKVVETLASSRLRARC